MGTPQEVLDQARERLTEASTRHVKAVAAVTEARAVLKLASAALASEPSNATAKKDLAAARAALQDAETWEIGWEQITANAREAVAGAQAALEASRSEDAATARAHDVDEAAGLLRAALDLEKSARELRSKMAAIAKRHGAAEAAWDVEARARADAFANDVRRAAGLPQIDGNGKIIESATEQRS